ncbi:hypothetical protein LEP1GSC076_2800 [Leptospira sp. Fiocruz LV4135]|nr:hypothetical protein LEP1GSC076_2800 [Leptospira sp. Fiocruz LV4135]
MTSFSKDHSEDFGTRCKKNHYQSKVSLEKSIYLRSKLTYSFLIVSD